MSSKIKYSEELIKYMSYFESVTRTKVKDCFIDLREMLTFVVEPGEIIKAVGKNASNVKKLEQKLSKKIRIIEFNADKVAFMKNLVHPNKASEIKFENNRIYVTPADLKSRGYMIGKSAIMLKTNYEIMKRYFEDVEEIKILQVKEDVAADAKPEAVEPAAELEADEREELAEETKSFEEDESVESDDESEDEELEKNDSNLSLE